MIMWKISLLLGFSLIATAFKNGTAGKMEDNTYSVNNPLMSLKEYELHLQFVLAEIPRKDVGTTRLWRRFHHRSVMVNHLNREYFDLQESFQIRTCRKFGTSSKTTKFTFRQNAGNKEKTLCKKCLQQYYGSTRIWRKYHPKSAMVYHPRSECFDLKEKAGRKEETICHKLLFVIGLLIVIGTIALLVVFVSGMSSFSQKGPIIDVWFMIGLTLAIGTIVLLVLFESAMSSRFVRRKRSIIEVVFQKSMGLLKVIGRNALLVLFVSAMSSFSRFVSPKGSIIEVLFQKSFGSLIVIKTTALLGLCVRTLRIVRQKGSISDTLPHSQTMTIVTKEMRQYFPTQVGDEAVRQCKMCINHSPAVAHCKTCKLNICTACNNLHKRVWALLKHDVCHFNKM